MTLNEIYALTPASVSNELHRVRKFIPESEWGYAELSQDEFPFLQIKYYADHCFDGRRVWELYSIWFNDKPIMLCQEAGREGDDHDESFITDPQAYRDLVNEIRKFAVTPTEDKCDPNVDLPEYTEFYRNNLSEFYDPNLKPKYKVGDVVMAMVPINHLRSPYEKHPQRVRIERIKPFQPNQTYHGTQLDRRCGSEIGEYVTDVGNGSIGANFCDSDVLEVLSVSEKQVADQSPETPTA